MFYSFQNIIQFIFYIVVRTIFGSLTFSGERSIFAGNKKKWGIEKFSGGPALICNQYLTKNIGNIAYNF